MDINQPSIMDALQLPPAERARVVFFLGRPHVFVRGTYALLIDWMFVLWLSSISTMGTVAFYQDILGLKIPAVRGLTLSIAQLTATADRPVPFFGKSILAMVAIALLRSFYVTTPSYTRCLDVFRPRPQFRKKMDEILHRASAMATFALSVQLLACLWYLTFISMERELENATQPDAEAISFSSILGLVFLMLNRIVPAYGMAIASFHQILGTAEITILEINVAFILINLGWALLYRLN